MAYLKLESFHVNVGSGDGAIHLLTSDRHGTNKRTIERAFLVDGGRDHAADTIDKVVQYIEQHYVCKFTDPLTKERLLMFDAIVITHWDGDHWEGLVRYIMDATLKVLYYEGINHVNQVYCCRARYDSPDPKTGFHGEPRTFIYMPYVRNYNTGLVQGTGAGDQPVMGTKLTEKGKNGQPDKEFLFTNQFKLRYGYDWLLGRNLLLHDNDDKPLSQKGYFASLGHMLGKIPIVNPVSGLQYNSWPAMYCVAAQQRIPSSNAEIKTTPTNMSSLTFIMVWSEPSGQGRRHRVSHYFAGDAHSALETALAGWMGDLGPTAMKLSHHGSSSSNPPSNFTKWNPISITVSAGEQYGHPRWEVLFCMAAWFQLREHQVWDTAVLPKFFFPCQWPAYLRQDADQKFMKQTFSIEGLLSPNTDLVIWIKEQSQAVKNIRVSKKLLTHPKDISKQWYDYVDDFQDENQRYPNELETRTWISKRVGDIMERICPLPSSVPTAKTVAWIPGTNKLDPTASVNKTMAELFAIKFSSTPESAWDSNKPQAIGGGSLPEWVLDSYDDETVFDSEMPANCSVAYVLANLDLKDSGEELLIDQYPYLGADHPQVIDITRGDPKWPKKKSLGHVESDEEARGPGSARRDSWIDVDFEEYVFDVEDGASQHKQDISQASRSSSHIPILYRRVTPAVSQAAVYIACKEKKTSKPPRYFPADSQVVILDEENFLYGFTDTLHYRKFSLAEVPNGKAPTPLFRDDEIFNWLGHFCAEDSRKIPDNFEMQLCTMPWPMEDKKARLDFAVTMPFMGGYKLRFSTNVGAEETFAKSTTDTSGKDTEVSFVALTNMLISRRTLVFGLEKSNPTLTTTLKAAATFIGVDMNNYRLFNALASNAILILDPSKDYHNAIWFRPGMQYQTHMRLQFHVDDDLRTSFNSWLQKLSKDLSVASLHVIMRKRAKWIWSAPTDRIRSRGSVTFLCSFVLSPTVQLQGVLELSNTQMLLTLTLERPKSKSLLEAMQGRDGAVDTIIKWISCNFGVTDTKALSELLDTATKDGSSTISNESILPRRVSLVLDLKDDGSIAGINAGSIDIEACINVGLSAVAVKEQRPVLFLLSFGWSKDSGVYFKGGLWPVVPTSPFSEYDRALPEAEEYQVLTPATDLGGKEQHRTLDLATLLSSEPGKQVRIPAGLPSEIYACEIALSQKEVSFRGSMRSKPSSSGDTQTPPIFSFEDLELTASYAWDTEDPTAEQFKLKLKIAMNLYLGGKIDPTKPQEEQDEKSAKLSGQLSYDKGTWGIQANVYDLSIRHLLEFWGANDRGSVAEFLGSINIDYLSIRYEFIKGSTNPSKLTFDGSFGIAEVATFSLKYINQGGSKWSVKAALAANNKAGPTATIKHLLLGFLDKDTVEVLPDAIKNAAIQGADGEEALRILCCRQGDVSVFGILVQVQMIQLWFVQLKTKDGQTKRILRAAISKISVNVSAINTTLNSPWDKLLFMWAQDTTPEKGQQDGKKAKRGLTQAEYDAMKASLQESWQIPDEDLMLFKQQEPKSSNKTVMGRLGSEKEIRGDMKDDDKAKDIVINAGMHLIIVAKTTEGKLAVILDYLFGGKSEQSKPSVGDLVPYNKAEKQPAPNAAGAPKGTKAPFKVKIGPLSVSNIGLWFKEGQIGITLDASLLLGPVGLALLGFTIGVPMAGALSKPPPLEDVTWGLQGLIVSLDKPPLTVAGGFMRDTSKPDIEVMYSGGLIVGFKPWMFEAMGAYANVKKNWKTNTTTIDTDPMSIVRQSSTEEMAMAVADDTFTFSFIYVRLNGPLFSVGFADFAGLVGGFGINSDIVLPTVDQVFEFPFVKERTEDESSLNAIERMQNLVSGPWFRPAEGVYWGAAGVRITAFQMLAANIVLVVQFGNGNVVIGLFGVATCDVPSMASPVKFAHAELGIICTYDVNSGIFKIEAQLSPRSFVLAPQCHLTGGLALYAWFKTDLTANVKAGDWVLTIGGYHKAFHPPRQYPIPPRLGINWSLDKNLSVVGEAYFAITPKLCMGGGRLHAALSLGALYAWFDAHVDFLMNFDPFFFQLQASLAVGVRFTLDLWLVTIRINAEVGASLDLQGPPFGGVVHVYFWVFGFDVKFGSPPPLPDPVSLPRFWNVVCKISETSGQQLLPAVAKHGDNAEITLTCENGLLPPIRKPDQKKDNKNETWYVKSGKFNLMATFQFAVTQADLTETRKILVLDATGLLAVESEKEETRSAHAEIEEVHKQVFGKPMQLEKPLTSVVTINIMAPVPKTASQQFFHVLDGWKDQKWKMLPIVKPVQTSLWGKYSRNLDPSLSKSPKEEHLDGSDATMPLVMGLTLHPPEPAPAGDMINKFNVTSDHMDNVYLPEDKEHWPLFLDVEKSQDPDWQPRGSSKTMRWEDLCSKWKGVGNKRPVAAVNLWAKRLRFDQESFDEDHKGEEKKPTFNPLRGQMPSALLDRYETMIPALPLVAVGM